MSNLNVMTDNKIIGSTVTLLSGTTENAQFPLSNIQSQFTTKVFRSNEANSVIQVAFDSAQSIDTFMIAGNNLTGLGVTSCTIEGSPTTSFPGTSIITVDLSADHNIGWKFFTSASFRYWKITLTGTSYCEISNLYLGARTAFENNQLDVGSFTYNMQENFKSKSNNYGQLFIDKYNTVNSISGSMQYINKTEFETLQNIYAEVGNTTPVWIILDEDGILSTDTSSKFLFSGYYYINGAFQFSSIAPSLWNLELNFIEVV